MFLPHLVRLVEMHYVLQHVTKLFYVDKLSPVHSFNNGAWSAI